MLEWTVLFLSVFQLKNVFAQKECMDLRGRMVSHGAHYVPGPDSCTLCVCDNGVPLECKAVLCSPPQECRSFRLGVTCCEFICLDDVVKPADVAEANVRVAAGGAAAVVLATVLFVVYRVRRQKRRRATHADDQRSITSIGYISGSMNYMSGACEAAGGAWKPPGNCMPRGEAPPPYEEVVAQCRAENSRLMSEIPFHRTYPASVEAMTRTDDPMQCNGHGYVNIPRQAQQMPSQQNCYNAPLLQAMHPADVRDINQMPHYPLVPNMSGLPNRARLTGSLGAISGRLAVPREEPERPHNVPGFYAGPHLHAAPHRTIPRISTAIDALELDAFRRAENAAICGANEVRRSFHRPAASRRDTARSVPRHLDLAADCTLESNARLTSGGRSRAQSSDNVGCGSPPAPPAAPTGPATAPVGPPAPAPEPPTLPLTVDKPSCECSYTSGAGAGGGGVGTAGGGAGPGEGEGAAEGEDDYRSECENCKSANSSRWVAEERWGGEERTQTLQRRAPPAPPTPPATATLPQPVTRTRPVMGPPSNWENWFNTIPDSDSESEEE